jgi:ABC-type multidrug transport system fused ATPase/permease subunit
MVSPVMSSNAPLSPSSGPLSRRLGALRVLIPFVIPEKVRIFSALIALGVASSATLALPVAVREVMDRGFDQGKHDVINTYFIWLIGLVGVLAIASSLRYYLVMTLGGRVSARVREAVFAHLTTLDVTFFDTVKSGSIVSRLTNDTELVRAVFGPTASVALRNIVLLLGAVIMMIYTSPWLSMMVLSVIPLIVLPLVFSGRAVRARTEAAQQRLADTSAFAIEAVGSARMMQASGMETATSNAFTRASREALEAARQSIASRALLTCGVIFFHLCECCWRLMVWGRTGGERPYFRRAALTIYSLRHFCRKQYGPAFRSVRRGSAGCGCGRAVSRMVSSETGYPHTRPSFTADPSRKRTDRF